MIGALSLVSSADSGRRFGEADLHLAEQLAAFAAIAIANARLFRDRARALRASEDMMAVVSHDLRNPLSVISTSARVLEAALDDSGQAKIDASIIARIQRNCGRMDRLIHDLLDAARVESGNVEILGSLIDAPALIREAVSSFEHVATDAQVSLHAQLEDCPPMIVCDGERIMQVISNLLGNAIDHSPPGGTVTVIVHAEPEGTRFVVEDEGPGIPPERVPQLFARFVRGDSGKREGVGLGLFIAKGLVDAHQGRIWFEARPGGGSRFCFTVPVAETTRLGD